MKNTQLLCSVIPQDPEIVAALQPGKEQLDKERLEIIGQSAVKLDTSRQVHEGQFCRASAVFRKSQPLGT